MAARACALMVVTLAATAWLVLAPGGRGRDADGAEWAALAPPMPGAAAADSLIREGEGHFARLWQLTFGGENAEAYWSADGRRLIFQSTRDGWPCDQEYVLEMATGAVHRVSTGTGRTTCGYFYDDDRRVLFASTHAAGDSCPPNPDMSHGYVWPLFRSFDLWTTTPDGRDLRRMTDHDGYDAEATVSPDGRWIVWTSARDGDVDLYKMRPDGSGLTRLTRSVGYDGGAFFSHDSRKIVWRTRRTDDSAANTSFRELLSRDLVKPTQMDLWVMDTDGKNPRQVTHDPGASFAPYFTPDDRAIIYASNRENPRGRNFDLYLVPVAGGTPEPVTRDPEFDSFPMFSPDGRWLVFCANRGGRVPGETNVFLAEWRR
jgi:TolB protein